MNKLNIEKVNLYKIKIKLLSKNVRWEYVNTSNFSNAFEGR